MKLKRCMIMGITACLIIGSMSGCSSKENGNSQSNQKEQTIQTNQTEEEISENEDVKNEEELQPTTVTVDYAEAFQSIQGCAVILNSENNTYTFYNEDKCRTRVSFYTYINYGNHDLSGGVSSFWAESSLKISPIEQVEMLQRLYINDFNFDADNIQTVKNALLLSSTADGNLYGKTGTGNINGENISGWFIGYVETSDNTYFFALNIGATENATGSKASDIALSILSDMNIWY